MKIWTKIEWAIISAAATLLLLLLILFAYNQPHSDDFSYNYFLQHKGYIPAFTALIGHSGGRFFSTFLIFLSPLKQHSIAGYQCLTAGLFLFFVASFYSFLYLLLRQHIATKTIVFLFALLLLCFLSFVPNLHEFAFWLSAEATYLTAAALWLWAIVFAVLLARPQNTHRWWLWAIATINAILIVGCSELGMMLFAIPLLLFYASQRQMAMPIPKGFWVMLIAFAATVAATVFSGGNMHRHSITPYAGNTLLAFSGGIYSAALWLSNWALLLVPMVCVYLFLFGHRLQGWAAQLARFRFFRAKTIFIGSILYFVAIQILVVWLSGSTPETRVQNILFLYLLLAMLLATQLMMHEQAEFFGMLKGKLHRGFKTLSFIYLICVFVVVPNNAVHALTDVLSGTAARYNQQSQERYQYIRQQQADIVAVPPISARPQLLYFHTLSCQAQPDTQDLPRICLADYFGKKWIYEYPCASEAQQFSIKDMLKAKRQQYFSKQKH